MRRIPDINNLKKETEFIQKTNLDKGLVKILSWYKKFRMKKKLLSEPTFDSSKKKYLLDCLNLGFLLSLESNIRGFKNKIKNYKCFKLYCLV